MLSALGYNQSSESMLQLITGSSVHGQQAAQGDDNDASFKGHPFTLHAIPQIVRQARAPKWSHPHTASTGATKYRNQKEIKWHAALHPQTGKHNLHITGP